MLLFPTRRRGYLLQLLALVLLAAACATAPPPSTAPAEPPPEPPPVEEAPDYRHKLSWTTASEVDNFGFDVYRSLHEEGPFERLTESPIPGAGTTDLTTSYEYEDHDIDPYLVYYYYVESISLQGVREKFTPIIRAKPKLPATEDATADDPAATPDEVSADSRR
jgi:hypothetical protein